MHSEIAPLFTAAPKKTTRPLHSKSQVFEDAHAQFVEDVITRNIKSVIAVETEREKSIIIAGCIRYSASKRTGLISQWKLVNFDQETASWKRTSLEKVSFWHKTNKMRSWIASAWLYRLSEHMPSIEECYPEHFDHKKNDLAFQYQYQQFMILAAERRLGSRDNATAAIKTFVQLLWKFLVDPDILRLCHRYFGHGATLGDYNLTVHHFGDLVARAAETPTLTRLIGHHLDFVARFDKKVRVSSTVLLDAKRTMFGDLLTPAGWRYIASAPESYINAIVSNHSVSSFDENGVKSAHIINFIADSGANIPLHLFKWLLSNLRHCGIHGFLENRSSVVRFIRLAGREATISKRRKCLRQFVSHSVMLAWDWFYYNHHDNSSSPRSIPKNFTWTAIMRAQERWHRELHEAQRLRRETHAELHARHRMARDATKWDSLVGAKIIDEVVVTPLVTGKELYEEGVRMTHCVDGYGESCTSGRSRIFHLDYEDELATLEIERLSQSRWAVRQVWGKLNTESSKKIRTVSKRIAKMYSQLS